jgi:hypothetical protein
MPSNFITADWFKSNSIQNGKLPFTQLIDERDEVYFALWTLCTLIVFSNDKTTIRVGPKPKIRKPVMLGAADSSAVHEVTGRTWPTSHDTVGDFDEITVDDDGGVTADDRVTAPVDVDALSVDDLKKIVREQQDIISKQKSHMKKQIFWKDDIATLFDDRTKKDFNLGVAIRELSMFAWRVRSKLHGFPDEPLFKELKRLKKCDQQNRDLLEFVSTMQKVIDPKGLSGAVPDQDHIVTATKAKFDFSRLVCSALSCKEDTFQDKLGVLQQNAKTLETEVALALAPLETDQTCTAFMQRVHVLSSSMQQINLAVPCQFIDKAPDMIHELHNEIARLKGASNQTHAPSMAGDDVAKMQDEIDRLNGDNVKLQAILLQARQDLLRANELISADTVKISQMELVLHDTQHKLQDVTHELQSINPTDVNPIVLTSRTAHLLGELHELIHENFSCIWQLDIVTLVDRMADVICRAFHDVHRSSALQVRLQLNFQPGDVDDGLTIVKFLKRN